MGFLHSFIKPYTWDDVSYHFPAVKEIGRGKVSFPLLSDSPYINYYRPFSIFYGSLPYASESFASVVYLLSISHPSSVQLLYFVNLFMFLVFVSTLLKNEYRVDLETRLVISILIISLYDVSRLISTGYVDLNVFIYQFLGISLLA